MPILFWVGGGKQQYEGGGGYLRVSHKGTQLTEAMALRPRTRLNFAAAFFSYSTNKKIKWLIFC